jgi:hypothetical protein
LSDTIGFLLGQKSFADIYRAQSQHYWPELLTAKQKIGINERLLSLTGNPVIGYVPGRSVESEGFFGYRDWHLMVFGSPEVAKDAFKKEGINYFIFNFDLFDFNKWGYYGALPHSPLFTPAKLNDNFDVVWSQNQTYLLTWKGEAKTPMVLPNHAIEQFAERIKSKTTFPDLYDRIKLYYDRNHGAAYPVVSDPSLPPVSGFE